MRQLVAAVTCFVLAPTLATATDLTAQLAAIASQSNAQITTIGRKTGKPHTVTVWFVVDGDAIYLTTLDEKRDWVRNAFKTPGVILTIATLRVQGQFSRVDDSAVDARIRTLRRQKYTLGRVAAWFGYDTASTFRVADLRLAGAP